MASLKNRIAFITGASSGIGRACARLLAGEGARSILAARRRERLDKLAAELDNDYGCPSLVVPMDVRDKEAVQKAVEGLTGEWASVDILLNDAGLGRGLARLYEGEIEDWEEMIDTNIKGLLYLSRALVPSMVERGRGDIINIGSIAGREVYPKGHVYCATKFAVHALSEGLRMDLVDTPLRVSEVCPGLVKTEFSRVRFRGDVKRAAKTYSTFRTLDPEDVAEAVLFCLTRPAHVSINQVVVMPSAQASIMVHHP